MRVTVAHHMPHGELGLQVVRVEVLVAPDLADGRRRPTATSAAQATTARARLGGAVVGGAVLRAASTLGVVARRDAGGGAGKDEAQQRRRCKRARGRLDRQRPLRKVLGVACK